MCAFIVIGFSLVFVHHPINSTANDLEGAHILTHAKTKLHGNIITSYTVTNLKEK